MTLALERLRQQPNALSRLIRSVVVHRPWRLVLWGLYALPVGLSLRASIQEIHQHNLEVASEGARSVFRMIVLARDVAMHHHERWDGKGYPEGRPSREYSLLTRIVSVVDVFDAFVSVRPYKGPWNAEQAVEEIKRGIGTQFDPAVVAAFLAVQARGEFGPLIKAAGKATPADRHN